MSNLARARELTRNACDQFEAGQKDPDSYEGAQYLCVNCGNLEFRHVIKALIARIVEVTTRGSKT